jgi:tetratricopeptide (TPR) repeat protein
VLFRSYQEALGIRRRLAAANPETYAPDVAMTLNNFAVLYKKTQRSLESEAMYQEALEIYRRLAAANPEAYEPNVASTLNNFALLYKKTQRFSESEAICLEALDIYNHLTKEHPQYRPKMNYTLNFLMNMYEEIRQSSTNKNRRRSYIRIFWQWITRKKRT